MTTATSEQNLIGPGQAAMNAWLHKDITLEEACVFTAHSTVESLADYEIRPYVDPSPRLRDYIHSRAAGFIDRDAELAVANGEWLQGVYQTWLLNKNDAEYLRWAADLCEKAESVGAAKTLRERMLMLEMHPFPLPLYNEARRVQQRDGDDRSKGGAQSRPKG